MAKYVLIVEGAGTGCDYSIDCNKTFDTFRAESFEEVVEYVRENVVEYYSDDRVDWWQVFEIKDDLSDRVLDVFLEERKKAKEEKDRKLLEEIKQRELEELRRLEAKYKNGK